jgi:hypothetical protein
MASQYNAEVSQSANDRSDHEATWKSVTEAVFGGLVDFLGTQTVGTSSVVGQVVVAANTSGLMEFFFGGTNENSEKTQQGMARRRRALLEAGGSGREANKSLRDSVEFAGELPNDIIDIAEEGVKEGALAAIPGPVDDYAAHAYRGQKAAKNGKWFAGWFSKSRAPRSGIRATLNVLNKTCFVAGTPILTPNGAKMIEAFKVGDQILSRPEDQPDAPVRTSVVEALFELSAPILQLGIGGRTIETTAEHPFYVAGKGWLRVEKLASGDLLVGHNDQLTPADSITRTDRHKTVYNVRVAEDHTYFVGNDDWGFSVWVHNAYSIRQAADGTWEVLDDLGNVVRHQSLERALPGGHVWSRHAHEWFGLANRLDHPSARQVEEWVNLIERVGRSKNTFAWTSGAHETVAHLAKVDGKWFVVQYYKHTGVLASAFIPNANQLAAMFRILGW